MGMIYPLLVQLHNVVLLILYKLIAVQHVLLACQFAGLCIGVELNLDLALLSRLGSYNYYTITTSCTIDGGQRGILQYVDRCDIRWRNIVDVVSLEAVDDEQGAVL